MNDNVTFNTFILWDNLIKSFYHPVKFYLNQNLEKINYQEEKTPTSQTVVFFVEVDQTQNIQKILAFYAADFEVV